VEAALKQTANLRNIAPDILRRNPRVLPILRMATAPPIARDRLIGLAKVSPTVVKRMELDGQVPPRMARSDLDAELTTIGNMIQRLADTDIFPWLETKKTPSETEVHRAATIVADRLCGAVADPIIRNAQEQRQLAALRRWLEGRGYTFVKPREVTRLQEMRPRTFTFRLNLPVKLAGGKTVNIPIDSVIMPKAAPKGNLPLLVEAKSAGDFTNVNKRRKEEAVKMAQLRATYGEGVCFVLLLCGYFDTGYLGYEAAEGIDWVWEHRLDDFAEFAL
jgi:hypothetical protein